MATHHPQGPGFAPEVEFEFPVALGVLEASEALAVRRQPLTPETLVRPLGAPPFAARPTRRQIQRGLAHVQGWRDHLLTRDLLQHRSQLVALGAQLRTQQQQLDQDQFYLDQMLRATDALLQNTLRAPDREPSLPASGATLANHHGRDQ